jgi:hypothetical protein
VTAGAQPVAVSGADVRIGDVEPQLAGATASGALWQAAPGRFLLRVPGAARYLVEEGTRVTVDPEELAPSGAVERFLHATPLAAVHLQRGQPVLHAAAVEASDGGAIVLAGDSCSGKSTLAAALALRGFRVLADDLSPLALADGSPVVVPTAREPRLWPDAAGQLGVADDSPQESTARPVDAERRGLRPSPVRGVWWLDVGKSGTVEVSDVLGAARFAAVAAIASNSRIAKALLDRGAFLAIAGATADAALPIRRLVRPLGTWCVAELADKVASAG